MTNFAKFDNIRIMYDYIYGINQIMKNSKIDSKYYFGKKSKSYRVNSEYGAGYLSLDYNIDEKYIHEFKKIDCIVNGSELFKFLNENVKHKSDIDNISCISFNKNGTFTIEMKNGISYRSIPIIFDENTAWELSRIKEYEELDKYFKDDTDYIELTPEDIEMLQKSITPEVFCNKSNSYKTFLSNRTIYNFPKSDIKNGIKMEIAVFKEMIMINRFIIKNKKYIIKNTFKSLNFNHSKQQIEE